MYVYITCIPRGLPKAASTLLSVNRRFLSAAGRVLASVSLFFFLFFLRVCTSSSELPAGRLELSAGGLALRATCFRRRLFGLVEFALFFLFDDFLDLFDLFLFVFLVGSGAAAAAASVVSSADTLLAVAVGVSLTCDDLTSISLMTTSRRPTVTAVCSSGKIQRSSDASACGGPSRSPLLLYG